jgi:hypothetical protein
MAGAKSSKQRHRKHGLVALRRAIEGSIDPHSKLGLALAGLRNALVADLGGHDVVSEAQRLVIDGVIRAKLRADAADAWLDLQPVESRLDARVLAIEREARAQGDALVKYLGMLGLERRSHVRSFEEHMANLMANLPPDDEHQEADDAAKEGQGGDPTIPDLPTQPVGAPEVS